MIFYPIYTYPNTIPPTYEMYAFLFSFISAQSLAVIVLVLEKKKQFQWLQKIF